MKRLALFLVLVLILSTLFSSCVSISSGKDDVEKLMDKVDKTMSKLKSYESDMKMDMTFGEGNSRVTSETIARGVLEFRRGMLSYYNQTSQTKLRVGDSDTIVVEDLVAFDGEKIYLMESSEDESGKICSVADAKEFDEYMDDEAEFDIHIKDAFEKHVEVNEDSYTVTLGSYNMDAINDMIVELGLDNDFFDFDIVDADVKLNVDKKFRADTMEVHFYENIDEDPVISITVTYSKYNDAERPEMDVSGYTEVADVRVLEWMNESLDDKKDEKSGRFYLEQYNKIVYKDNRNSPVKINYDYSYDVKYTDTDDNFTCTIGQRVVKEETTLEYSGGYTVVKDKSGKTISSNNAYTNDQMRDHIAQMLSVATVPAVSEIKNIEKVEDGVYRIDCKITDIDSYKSVITSRHDKYVGYTYTVTVCLDGEQVTSIEYSVEVEGETYVYLSYGLFKLVVEEADTE